MDNLKHESLTYGGHERQQISVWRTEKSGYWVIFIHGGAWRDPALSDASFAPTITAISSPTYTSTTTSIAGYASIDYRLTAHPSYPQPSNTPSSKLNNAKHPDHISDVRSALNLLQSTYGFGTNYVLSGHSCGATLALQSLMDPAILEISGRASEGFPLPKAVLGVCGIYDLRSMVDNHAEIGVYRDFVTDAFGGEEGWDVVSPARYGRFKEWEGKLALLVSSKGDELIEDAQIEEMGERLSGWSKEGAEVLVLKKELEGAHDDIWGNGVEMAKVVSLCIERLHKIEN